MNKNSQNPTEQMQADTAQAQQEPVAWRVRPFDYGIGYEGVDALTTRKEQCEMWERKGWKVEPLYAAPQPPVQQAPLAGARCKIIDNCKSCQHSAGRQSCMLADKKFEGREHPPTPPDWCPLPLYTAPQPARQLLTDEQMYSLYCEAMKGYYVSALHYWRNEEAHKFARAIEAAAANQPHRQPLTEDQLRDALRQCPHDTAENLRVRWLYAKEFARAVEAAHGIGSTHG